MDISDYHIATKRIHELEQELETTSALCKTLTTIVNEGMHWLPMSEDAVFEDGGKYQLSTTRNNDWPWSGIWDAEYGVFRCALGQSWLLRELTHYARITEPK